MDYEKLSALLDNEVSEFERDQLIEELLLDEDAQAYWNRQVMIRTALRNSIDSRKNGLFVSIREKLAKISSIQEN